MLCIAFRLIPFDEDLPPRRHRHHCVPCSANMLPKKAASLPGGSLTSCARTGSDTEKFYDSVWQLTEFNCSKAVIFGNKTLGASHLLLSIKTNWDSSSQLAILIILLETLFLIICYGFPSQLPAIGMSPGMPRAKTISAYPMVLLLRR